jgi:hypothetical protein
MWGFVSLIVFLMGLSFGLSPVVRGQSKEDSGKGLIWYEDVTGSSSSLGTVTRLDSTLGYNFNHYFAVDFGVPVLFVHASSSTSTTTTNFGSANGIGDVYLDLRFTFRNPAVNFVSTVRGTAPTGSTKNGFSSGRATEDWNNHFDRAFGHVTPFADLGVANTVPDSAYFVRPYTTLGLTGHFDGGASVRILPLLNFRASAYAIEPSGQQKVFSRLLSRQTSASPAGGTPGASHAGGVFQTSAETTGSADIARDHGFSLGFESSPFHVLDLAIGYTRSVSFSLNTVYFGVGLNLARVFGSPSHSY